MNKVLNREMLATRVKNARTNLLLVVALTVLNIVLLIVNSDSYFLFSACVPYVMVSFGMLLCGMYPADFYGEDFVGVEFLPSSIFAVFMVVAVAVTALYFLSWLFSKEQKKGWLVFSLVFFAIDTLVLFLFMSPGLDGILDIVFHVWVLVSLAMGVHACSKLSKLPPEEEAPVEESEAAAEEEETAETAETTETASALRVADPDAKARILLDFEALGHTIVYRRVKRVNELVIDGYVYDEMEALVESAHSLTAVIDGHEIEVGFDGVMHSYLKVDDEPVAKKLRLY